ncbi:CBS domain-containing protein [Desulforhopalus vacuolatus]|uniref:CBS domain-containing protein n=1 Tax=Desulforhopalus vacuolatus TaxID=40414 RepID=UPI0019626022|nr:CBS domain-containing protein [Desulforhopalus vacuolatus]MBM9518799.1 CBS domain-containing protein [Desulforhopalus vacuolatus]
MKEIHPADFISVDISEHDVIEAMKHIPGYIDITPGDFKAVYQFACTFARDRLLSSLTAEKIMTVPVIFVDQEMPLVEVAELLAEKHISGCPVVGQQGRIVGVVSEKDFLKEMGFGVTPSFMQLAVHCLNSKSCMIHKLHNKTVGSIMTTPPITADTKITIGAISTLFAQHQINRVPIVDNEGKPVGLVSRTDLAHSYQRLGERAHV